MEDLWKIFISGTWEDLTKDRKAVVDAIERQPNFRVIDMGDFGARTGSALEESLAELGKCHAYVGIIGNRYGSRTESGLSFTEVEYNFAEQNGKKRLVYVATGDALDANVAQSARDRARQDTFRKRLHRPGITVKRFTKEMDLPMLVVSDLLRELQGGGA